MHVNKSKCANLGIIKITYVKVMFDNPIGANRVVKKYNFVNVKASKKIFLPFNQL